MKPLTKVLVYPITFLDSHPTMRRWTRHLIHSTIGFAIGFIGVIIAHSDLAHSNLIYDYFGYALHGYGLAPIARLINDICKSEIL